MRCHQVCQRLTAHQIATVELLLAAAVAIISLVLSAGFLNFLRVYLLAFSAICGGNVQHSTTRGTLFLTPSQIVLARLCLLKFYSKVYHLAFIAWCALRP